MATTVNTKGQVTIPEPLRRKYGFLPGTRVIWVEQDGQIIPHPVRSILELRGFLSRPPGEITASELLLQERQADRERE
jgi:AbrB family looped-hinge helix DNA binding protein